MFRNLLVRGWPWYRGGEREGGGEGEIGGERVGGEREVERGGSGEEREERRVKIGGHEG